MPTFEGFLESTDGKPSMTRGQKDMVRSGCRAALSLYLPRDAADCIMGIVDSALDGVPDSRACVACDYHSEGYCTQWRDDIPDHIKPVGCKKFQDDGAPF